MLSDGMMLNTNDKNNQSIGDVSVVHRQIEINEHPPIEATTMMKLLATSTENAEQISDSNSENKALEEMNEKCILGK